MIYCVLYIHLIIICINQDLCDLIQYFREGLFGLLSLSTFRCICDWGSRLEVILDALYQIFESYESFINLEFTTQQSIHCFAEFAVRKGLLP